MDCSSCGQRLTGDPCYSVFMVDYFGKGTGMWGHYCSATCVFRDVGNVLMNEVKKEQREEEDQIEMELAMSDIEECAVASLDLASVLAGDEFG